MQYSRLVGSFLCIGQGADVLEISPARCQCPRLECRSWVKWYPQVYSAVHPIQCLIESLHTAPARAPPRLPLWLGSCRWMYWMLKSQGARGSWSSPISCWFPHRVLWEHPRPGNALRSPALREDSTAPVSKCLRNVTEDGAARTAKLWLSGSPQQYSFKSTYVWWLSDSLCGNLLHWHAQKQIPNEHVYWLWWRLESAWEEQIHLVGC